MALLLIASALLAIVVVLHQVTPAGSRLPLSVEWMEKLSVERYRPMLRLLEQKDLSFLRSQPGFEPAMARRLRRQRSAIFRGYLHNLIADFRRTCGALKLIMLYSGSDRPDLARVLLRAQMAFASGLVLVHFRVVLYRLGLASVDATGLVKLFDVMQLELRSLIPLAIPGIA